MAALLRRIKNKTIKSRFVNNKGFSLVEVLVGVIIFAIIILSIFRIFAFSTIQNKRTNDFDELHSIAQRSMEYLKSNVAIIVSPNFQEITDYTIDEDTKKRFTVIYKAKKVAVPEPENEYVENQDDIPTLVNNYNIEIEVFFSKDKSELGSIGENSKVSIARSKNIPIVSLNSQLTQ